MKFSPFFTLAELTFSDYATRHGIDNTPPPNIQSNLSTLSWWLDELRNYVSSPIIVSSGYRCPAVNAGIGGSLTSAHMKGFAADITCSKMTPLELATLAADCMTQTGYDQIIHEFGKWVHCGLSPTPRMQLLTATLSGGKTIYVNGLK